MNKQHKEDYKKGRLVFLSLLPLPDDASEAMRAGFEAEAEKVRNTSLNQYMEEKAQEVGL